MNIAVWVKDNVSPGVLFDSQHQLIAIFRKGDAEDVKHVERWGAARIFEMGRRGRPKGSKNLATIVAEQAAAPILVKQGDKQRYMSKQEVAISQMMNKAAAGDMKALTVFLDFFRKISPLQPSAQEAVVLDQRDLQAMERLADFFSSTAPTGSSKKAQS